MRALSLIAVLSLFLAGCGFKDLPKMKATTDQSLKAVVMEYRLRADIVPHLIDLVQDRKDSSLAKLVPSVQVAYSHAIGMDLPIEQLNEMQMNRLASFQIALGSSLTQLMAALGNDPKVNKGAYLSLKEQLDRAESRLAIARQKYREEAQSFNERLTKAPTKWYNRYHYKYQPFSDLQ